MGIPPGLALVDATYFGRSLNKSKYKIPAYAAKEHFITCSSPHSSLPLPVLWFLLGRPGRGKDISHHTNSSFWHSCFIWEWAFSTCTGLLSLLPLMVFGWGVRGEFFWASVLAFCLRFLSCFLAREQVRTIWVGDAGVAPCPALHRGKDKTAGSVACCSSVLC